MMPMIADDDDDSGGSGGSVGSAGDESGVQHRSAVVPMQIFSAEIFRRRSDSDGDDRTWAIIHLGAMRGFVGRGILSLFFQVISKMDFSSMSVVRAQGGD